MDRKAVLIRLPDKTYNLLREKSDSLGFSMTSFVNLLILSALDSDTLVDKIKAYPIEKLPF